MKGMIVRLGMRLVIAYNLVQSGLPLSLVFADDAAERRSVADELRDVALQLKGKVNFATVDAVKLHFLQSPSELTRVLILHLYFRLKMMPLCLTKGLASVLATIEKFVINLLRERERRARAITRTFYIVLIDI